MDLANISPIFKKEHRNPCSNYRPIFLISKILERIISDEFLGHIVDYSFLSKAQHGFVPVKSCLSKLLETLNYITLSHRDGHCEDEILSDLAKAFDLVRHR